MSEIEACLEQRPFERMSVFLSDGSHHEVPHPELAVVVDRTLRIDVVFDGGRKIVRCDSAHVTRIELIDDADAA